VRLGKGKGRGCYDDVKSRGGIMLETSSFTIETEKRFFLRVNGNGGKEKFYL
jgi:hypothetical protein